MVISLGCDFSVVKENFEIYTCFMVIRGKCFYSGRIKDSDYCFENQLSPPNSELKLKIRFLIWIICSSGQEGHCSYNLFSSDFNCSTPQ